jgi:hypothetical protein
MSRFANICDVQRTLDAMEQSAASRRATETDRIARKRTGIVTAQLLHIDQYQYAEGRLDFPGDADSGACQI